MQPLARSWGAGAGELEAAWHAPEAELERPSSPAASRRLLRAMAATALVDGEVAPAERELLLEVGERLGLSPQEVEQTLAQLQRAVPTGVA